MKKNGKVSPSISSGKIWLSNVASPSFYVYNAPNLSLIGNIVSCNSFKLSGIHKIHANKLLQVLSENFEIDSAISIDWNGFVSSCDAKGAKKICMNATEKVNLLSDSKLVSKDLAISAGSSGEIYVDGLLSSKNLLSIDSQNLEFLDNSRVLSDKLMKLHCKNFISSGNSSFHFKDAEISANNISVSSKFIWDGELLFKHYTSGDRIGYINLEKSILKGNELSLEEGQHIKISPVSTIDVKSCAIQGRQLDLDGTFKFLGCNIDVHDGVNFSKSSVLLSEKNIKIDTKALKISGVVKGSGEFSISGGGELILMV